MNSTQTSEPWTKENMAAVEALKDMFAMIDEGLFVRDISKDHEPDYHIRAIAFTQRLSNNHAALAKINEINAPKRNFKKKKKDLQ